MIQARRRALAAARSGSAAGGPDPSPPLPRLYTDLAWVWRILSPPEDYREEAQRLYRAYRRRAVRPRSAKPRLLELGSGGGHLLLHLTPHFECTASDVSEQMLSSCARLVPGVPCVRGDMRELRLNEAFDVVLIHDAVDYMTTTDDVRAALRTAREHLAPGGVVFVAPTYVRETFVDGESASDGEAEAGLTYLTYVHDPDPTDSHYEMILVFLVRAAATRAVQVIEDRHRCGLFAEAEWLARLDEAGFDAVRCDSEDDWTLFAGTLRCPEGAPPAG